MKVSPFAWNADEDGSSDAATKREKNLFRCILFSLILIEFAEELNNLVHLNNWWDQADKASLSVSTSGLRYSQADRV